MANSPSRSGAPSAGRTILFVIDGLDIGGAQRLLLPACRGLRRRGHRVLVCVLQNLTDLRESLEEAGAEVILLGRARPGLRTPLALADYIFGGLRDISGIIKKERPDVLHAHLSDAEFLGLAAGLLAGVPMIAATVHSPKMLPHDGRFDPRNVLRKLLTRTLFNRADWIVAVSDETRDNLERVFRVDPARLRVIENGIDLTESDGPPKPGLRASLGLPPDKAVVACVGRLSPKKGNSVFLGTAALLADRGDAVFLLVGDGPRRTALEREAAALGLTGRAFFAGFRRDVADILSLADVYVMPSYYEGVSLALLEAMAAGKPIAATDIPGNRKVLQPDENCLMAPPGDPEALSLAVARLLDDGALAARLGANARERVRRDFGVDRMLDAYEALWAAPRPGSRRARAKAAKTE